METKVVYNVPDATYFKLSDVAPKIEGNVIALTEGRGTSRSWGRPHCESAVVVETSEFVAVHVGFTHEHRGGQGWFYFSQTEKGPERRIWRQLSQDEQDLVLGNLDKAPTWAKYPGVRKADIRKPADSAFVAFKVLRVTGDDEFESLYDLTRWKLGRRNGQAVGELAGVGSTHDGGYYVHPDMGRLLEMFNNRTLAPESCFAPGKYALVKCECSGRRVAFSNGKLAVTYCRPLVVVSEMEI